MGHRTRATVAVDALAVVLVAGALGLLAVRLGRAVQSPADGVLALAMIVTGYLAADALTGLVHWFCDTFFDETTPVLGPASSCRVPATSTGRCGRARWTVGVLMSLRVDRFRPSVLIPRS